MDTTLQNILLSCGILTAIAYFGTDRLIGGLIKDYSFSFNSMSDICAMGSPKRTLSIILMLLACILMVAFGFGVWEISNQVMHLRVVSILLVVNAIFGLVASAFFPNRYGERPKFFSIGVILMFISVLSFFLAMVFGAVAINGWFRIFSIMFPIIFVFLTIIRLSTASKSEQDSNSLIGSQERTMAYSYNLWLLVFALYLLFVN